MLRDLEGISTSKRKAVLGRDLEFRVENVS
jgi:hypothetical protein